MAVRAAEQRLDAAGIVATDGPRALAAPTGRRLAAIELLLERRGRSAGPRSARRAEQREVDDLGRRQPLARAPHRDEEAS